MAGDFASLGHLSSPLHDMQTRAPDEARSGYARSSGSTALRGLESSPRRPAAARVEHIALPIVASIPRFEIEQQTFGARCLFVVEVVGFGEMSRVKYPFEKFEEFYHAVAKKTRYVLPELPPSQWFGAAKPEVAEERRGKLESLLQKMLMLQEVLDDNEELIWQFLKLPRSAVVAARFLSCRESSKSSWLQVLWEASADRGGHKALQHERVEKALVHLARKAGSTAEGEQSHSPHEAISQASIACELLARIFGRTGESGRDPSLGAEPDRHEWIEVLLMSVRIDEPMEPPSDSIDKRERLDSGEARRLPLREQAGKALRTLARSNREAWVNTLGVFLDTGGLAHLANTAAARTGRDAGEGAVSCRQPLQRLVTELLLRGFDKPVVRKFTGSDVAKDRRSLLNTLFMSGDTFVRIMVGLILSGLLCEDGFADEEKANLGLQALLEDLQQKIGELAQADITQLLEEVDIWAWLCALVAAPRPLVNTFALLVVTHVVEPSSEKIFGTDGFHETLLALCAPEADPNSRYYASKLLLLAYREDMRAEGTVTLPSHPSLGHLCSCLAINFQAKYEFDLGQENLLENEACKASQWVQAAASFDEIVQQARADATDMRSEASAWETSVVAAGESTDLTLRTRHEVNEALAEFSASLNAATDAIGDGTPTPEEVRLHEELLAEEALFAQQKHTLHETNVMAEAVAEERNVVMKHMAEKDEEAWKLEANIEQATENAQEAASLGTPPGLETHLSNCRLRYAEAREDITAMRGRSEMLDERLSQMCEPIPAHEADIESSKRLVEALRARYAALGQTSTAVDTWAGLFDRQKEGSSELEAVRRNLRDVRRCVTSERERRRALRVSLSRLVASLTQLDGHLEDMESWDTLDAEGCFLSVDAGL